jgi:hypothetical protein
VRGIVQMHNVRKGARGRHRFLHTCDIREDAARPKLRGFRGSSRAIVAPAVLVPRVGAPDRNKIVLYEARQAVILSDCLIGLECTSWPFAQKIRKLLRTHWVTIQSHFGGTCAPYITIRKLRQVLADIGIPTLLA